jgi:hypothetical protein
MEFFDIEEKIIGQSQILDDLMFFLMENAESETGKEILGFLCLGDE